MVKDAIVRVSVSLQRGCHRWRMMGEIAVVGEIVPVVVMMAAGLVVASPVVVGAGVVVETENEKILPSQLSGLVTPWMRGLSLLWSALHRACEMWCCPTSALGVREMTTTPPW